jgi:hypothetical protein
MMDRIAFNLAVYAVPVVPGRPGADERLVRLGDGIRLDRTPAPRVRPAAALGALCGCGARGCEKLERELGHPK